jgi:hypothetical protein
MQQEQQFNFLAVLISVAEPHHFFLPETEWWAAS